MKYFIITIILMITCRLTGLDNHELLVEYIENSEDFVTYNLVNEEEASYLKAENHQGEISYIFISREVEEVRGYQSKSKIILHVNKDKIIQEAKLFRSKDTPSFVKRIQRSNFFQQFVGWNGNREIIAVTGATITCNAVETSISNMLKRIKEVTLIGEKNSEP